jgi:adenine-specific DNA-methyltransferase
VLDAVQDRSAVGRVRTAAGVYLIERGELVLGSSDAVWTLSTRESSGWLDTVHTQRDCTFDDIAHIRVGIKSTADSVFIREDWESLPFDERPEAELLRPLISRDEVGRWRARSEIPSKHVLYPYSCESGRRTPVRLSDFPRAAAYFQRHAARLRSRTYVVESGREWYEIWVPHHPAHWSQPKIVFPDIAETPSFFFDTSGAIVSGECYWITLRAGKPLDWLMLMLAVANSSFAVRYYDVAFHNKLYAGRRRFQTQYVRGFPLPRLDLPCSQEIIGAVRDLLAGSHSKTAHDAALDRLVWQAFGLVEEI